MKRGLKENVTYETRYRHKLNMLEPGTAILKWTGILLAAGPVLLLTRLRIAAYIAFGLAGTLAVTLAVLLAVEAHQDRVLNELAEKEREQDRPFCRVQ